MSLTNSASTENVRESGKVSNPGGPRQPATDLMRQCVDDQPQKARPRSGRGFGPFSGRGRVIVASGV